MKTNEELQALDKAELKKYAFEDLALELKGNLSEETLIQKILEKQEQIIEDQKPDLIVPEKPKKSTPEYEALANNLKETLKSQTDRGLGLEIDDVSYTISYRGQVISGNLTVPSHVVLRQADIMLNRK